MALRESGEMLARIPDLGKMKARIELVGDFEDVKTILDVLRKISKATDERS